MLLAAALSALCGCLTPPPIEEEPQSESAPVVDESQVIPQGALVELPLPQDPDQEFSVAGAATDPDGDPLYYYWYLLDAEDQTGVLPHTTRQTVFYRPCAEDAPPLPDELPAWRFLEVDITDRPRVEGPDGEELEEPRTYPEDAHVVTLDWVLRLEGAGCPVRPEP